MRVVTLAKEGRTDTERPCEAWKRGLRLGMLGGARRWGREAPAGKRQAEVGWREEGKVVWHRQWRRRWNERDGTRGVGGGSKGTGGGCAVVRTVVAGGGKAPGEECASTHLATSEMEDRWVSPSVDW